MLFSRFLFKWIYKERNKLGKFNLAKRWHQARVQKYYKSLLMDDLLIKDAKQREDVIVSMTMKPGREVAALLAVKSLLHQRVRPGKLILWLAPEEFDINKLDEEYVKLQKHGLTIKYTERNLKSYNKIIPTLSHYPNKKIVTSDDDILYPPWWLSTLLIASDSTPGSVIGYRCFNMKTSSGPTLDPYSSWPFVKTEASHLHYFATGVSGVCYPVNSLGQNEIDVKLITSICPYADDVWLKIQSLLHKIPVRQVFDYSQHFPMVKGTQENALQKINKTRNDEQLANLINHYNISIDDFYP